MPARIKFGKANTTPTKKRARPAIKVQSLTLDVWVFYFKVCTKFFRACQPIFALQFALARRSLLAKAAPRDNRQFWC